MNPTKHHLEVQAGVIEQLEKYISQSTRPFVDEKGETKITLDQWLKTKEAKTPKQIAEVTSEYINGWGDSNAGVIRTDQPFTIESNGAKFEFGNTLPMPAILNEVKRTWGNGKGNPVCTIRGKDDRAKSVQFMVLNERQNVLGDTKARKAFLSWLKKADKNDPLYRCRKFILNEKSVEGIHLPYTEQPRVKVAIRVNTYKGNISDLPDTDHMKKQIIEDRKLLKTLQSKTGTFNIAAVQEIEYTPKAVIPAKAGTSTKRHDPASTATQPQPYTKRIIWQAA